MCLQRLSGTACFYNRVHHRSKFQLDFPSPAITWNIIAAKAARGWEEHLLWEHKEEICACAQLGQEQVLRASSELFIALHTGPHIFPIFFFFVILPDIFHYLYVYVPLCVINLLFGLPRFFQCFLSTCLFAFALISPVICSYAPQQFPSHTPLFYSITQTDFIFNPTVISSHKFPIFTKVRASSEWQSNMKCREKEGGRGEMINGERKKKRIKWMN